MNDNMIMLSEFERQIDELLLLSSKGYDFNEIVNLINYQKDCWQLCRFDLKNRGNTFNRVNIFENPNNLHIRFPSWFKDDYGQGCHIEGSDKKLNLKVQCVNKGTLKIYLRGVDYRDVDNIRYPVYVNFTTFKINDNLIFQENKLIYHDQPYEFEIVSDDKDMFEIYLEFKTIFDYYPFFLNYFNNVKDMDELNEEYVLFKKQVKFIRFLEHFDEINESSLEMYDFMNKSNEVSLCENEENLLSYDSFLNHYAIHLYYFELKNHIDQLNERIEFLENKLNDYETN
ncbi:hypothetical protein [uncultured Methanobrevibacter sp.]|uniref:hypothetical protein n=1 Tax=uncultured Methanobrevibacter sp. TaxID=253161 RepID=UPI0025FE6CF0|nr:hypothetical protein [uncultured Methanobrevibacter sp.]